MTRRRQRETNRGFEERWHPEGLAWLTADERDGQWAHGVLESYLRGAMIRTSGISPRTMITYDRRQIVWNLTRGRCAYCGEQTNPFLTFTVDHFVPISAGGTDAFPNLIPSCNACNSAKGDKMVEEWFAFRSFRLWIAERALDYYRAVVAAAKRDDATFGGVPLWLASGLVIVPDPPADKLNGRRARKEAIR